jgi:exodeoxyribonuclease VII small subunit
MDMADGIPQKIADLGFEEALKELEGIVRALESGDGKLDDAIASYERGAALKKHCEGKLAEAKNRIERISFADDNAATIEPIEIG